MALASRQGPSRSQADARRGVAVIDAIEIRPSLGLDHAPGVVVVLDAFAPNESQKYVDRLVVVRAPNSEPRPARIGAVRDHGPTISFFFQNLTKVDVPIGSRIDFEA